jgi:hypothetical protein
MCESLEEDVDREGVRVEIVESDKAMRGKENKKKDSDQGSDTIIDL